MVDRRPFSSKGKGSRLPGYWIFKNCAQKLFASDTSLDAAAFAGLLLVGGNHKAGEVGRIAAREDLAICSSERPRLPISPPVAAAMCRQSVASSGRWSWLKWREIRKRRTKMPSASCWTFTHFCMGCLLDLTRSLKTYYRLRRMAIDGGILIPLFSALRRNSHKAAKH